MRRVKRTGDVRDELIALLEPGEELRRRRGWPPGPDPRLRALRAGEPVELPDWSVSGVADVPPRYRSASGFVRLEPDGRLIPLEVYP